MSEAMIHPRTAAEIERLRSAWRAEFRDGARCAFLEKYEATRLPGGYPHGFHDWPLDQRNAWFAGFNQGRCDQLAIQRGERYAA